MVTMMNNEKKRFLETTHNGEKVLEDIVIELAMGSITSTILDKPSAHLSIILY